MAENITTFSYEKFKPSPSLRELHATVLEELETCGKLTALLAHKGLAIKEGPYDAEREAAIEMVRLDTPKYKAEIKEKRDMVLPGLTPRIAKMGKPHQH